MLTEKHPGLKFCVIPLLLLFGFALLWAVQWLTMGGGPWNALGWMSHRIGPSLFTVLALSLVTAGIWGVSGSLFAAGILVAVPALVLGFVNYFKLKINHSPLEISDFTLIKNLGELTTLSKGNLTLPTRGIAIIAGFILLLVLALWLDKALRPRLMRHLIPGVLCLALVLCLAFIPSLQLTVMEQFHMLPDSRIGQPYSNEVNGVLGGLYRAYALRNGTAPDGYGRDYMEQLLAELDASSAPTGDGKNPSVILILSESFFDLTTLPNVEFSEDPLPVFRALSEQTVSGTFHSSYCGYNTGNIERSVLTGLHSRYLPYGTSTCYMSPEDTGRLAALPELFRRSGYGTLALHTYNNQFYNREESFPILGFDRVLFEDDFYDDTRLKGGYLSDDYFADLIIANYEEMTAEGKPAFIFGISMENHQPYSGDKFEETDIGVSSPLLSEQEIGSLAAAAQGTRDADAALGKLTDYFSGREEDVILVFFGDHRPSLPTEDGQTIYRKLGACTDEEANLTPEELTELYSTCYLAWANYDAFDVDCFDENVRSGDMLLGNDILNWAGIRKTLFWHAVEALNSQVVSMTEINFVAPDGTSAYRPAGEAAEAAAEFEAILYDTFFGEQYITDRLNTCR